VVHILGGIDLIRRVEAKEAYGMTFTLLTTSEGKKREKPKRALSGWMQKKHLPTISISIGEMLMIPMLSNA
jgi:tyrosyl-tRNA synthetase